MQVARRSRQFSKFGKEYVWTWTGDLQTISSNDEGLQDLQVRHRIIYLYSIFSFCRQKFVTHDNIIMYHIYYLW